VITRIRGELAEIKDGVALVHIEALTYELLIPAADISSLLSQVGNKVEFFTLHYFEGQSQGSSFTPRLIGFANDRDRAFFELFTTVKGIGNRKALRALIRPFSETATAISNRDANFLVSLPEIGKRSAETIIAQLNGKVDSFVGELASTIELDMPPYCEDAIAMLIQLGETKQDAKRLIQLAINSIDNIKSADQLVQTSFQLKGKL